MGMYYHLLGLNESLSTDVRQKKQQLQTKQQQRSDTSRTANSRTIPIYQQVPKFRSKGGSTTSINSIGSDTSSHKSGADRFC